MRGKATQTTTPAQEPTRPGWTLMGCGCGGVMTVVLLVILGVTWFSYERSKSFERELGDPAARDRASRRILGYSSLPEGYHPMGGFSVPFVMEMAMLSDREPTPGETVKGAADAFRRQGFVFMKTRVFGDRGAKLREYFEGRRKTSDFFHDVDLKFKLSQALGRGELDAGGAHVQWVAQRGTMKLGKSALDEVLTRLLIQCPDDGHVRVGMWFAPAPAPASASGAAYDGTPADPDAIDRFLNHFHLCSS